MKIATMSFGHAYSLRNNLLSRKRQLHFSNSEYCDDKSVFLLSLTLIQ